MQTEALHHQQLTSPSFSSYSSDTLAQIAVTVIHQLRTDDDHNNFPQQNRTDDFEFAFFSTDPISSTGHITPTYPLFDQTLLNPETPPRRRRLPLKMLMADDPKDLDGVPEGSYCVWTPPCKNTGSTGSLSSKRWKLRDLLHRSHSDVKKDSLLFLGAGGKHSSADNGGAGGRSKRKLGMGWVV